VDLRRTGQTEPTGPTATTVTTSSAAAPPRPLAGGSGAFMNPLPSMLELSAAARAVAAETQLRPAIAVLQREVCWLTRSEKATVMTFDGVRRTVWTLDGEVSSHEIRQIVARVASGGKHEVFEHALIEPIGRAPARAVLALWRTHAARFEDDDVALVAALIGGVAATINRLLGADRP
jgi:hypothetical protein